MSTAPHTWPRLFIKEALGQETKIALSIEHTHYLLHVMRIREGDSVRLFNGRDGEWRATIAVAPIRKKDPVILLVGESLRPQETEPDLWLCCAPIKRAPFEYMIQKATELGVSVVQPILTTRTQVRDFNLQRLQAIAIEAAEQSERLSIPEIREPLSLDALIKNWPTKRLPVLCAEFGEALPVAQGLSSALAQARPMAAIITGPEGGFRQEEIAQLRALPESLCLRLGPRILRADTAALAALTCWQALCGDWKNKTETRLPLL
ncbi:MAG: 16S rRNA (uracil(1498)-N(3))-methyltransferase [Bdellovibrionales bacterium]|jgi:16S rRNA (uracil1498-N3)-methyltransferase